MFEDLEREIKVKADEYADKNQTYAGSSSFGDITNYLDLRQGFIEGAKFIYNKMNEWHNLNENPKNLPDEGEWVEGLYLYYYKDKVHWDVFKVRWYYEIGELDEKLVRWYSADENSSLSDMDYWNKVDEPDYWRKIALPTRNGYDRIYWFKGE